MVLREKCGIEKVMNRGPLVPDRDDPILEQSTQSGL
mgnify:CR=1 FL=1